MFLVHFILGWCQLQPQCTLYHVTKCGLSTDSLSSPSCSRSYWMTPCGLWRAQQTLLHTFYISFCQHVIESVNVFFDSPCTESMALKWFILKIWPTFAKIEKKDIIDLRHFSIIIVFDSTFNSMFIKLISSLTE